MNKAKRAVIKIASIEVEVFQLPTGEYVMSQSQVGKAAGVQGVLMLRFLDEKWLQGKLDKDYRNYKIPSVNDSSNRGGNNNPIKVIPISLASAFWISQTAKGNITAEALAYACVEETLQRRCDRAFNQIQTEEEYERETGIKYQTWLESREFLRDAHSSFVNCCNANDFRSAIAHDKITLAVCGKTARELRELEVMEGDPKVGLNHIDDKDVLVMIARVKLEFSRYRVGNVDERIKRAMKAVDN
ncbi:hypothetical protein I8751_13695 [Nostocaceae cyanobacterium CENA357]|uniref:KilA-N domain-containing protein n=1 Tax=Atlanticothrix silvestris CENA357 TaxID=1725252 RepID=A0A8J7HE67_9CYAN|nr:hypothetical protein [Atlanticothrix silvestris]MBH8553409.1 hypothetical protein [Atlanticothrix silvestris CENA357]